MLLNEDVTTTALKTKADYTAVQLRAAGLLGDRLMLHARFCAQTSLSADSAASRTHFFNQAQVCIEMVITYRWVLRFYA